MIDITTLARYTTFTSEEQRFQLALIKEFGGEDFITELCKVAHDLGYTTCLDDTWSDVNTG